MTDEEKHELDYLRHFYCNADFGPAHEDVVDIMNSMYTEETGNKLPKGYGYEE